MLERAQRNGTWVWIALAFVLIAGALIILPMTGAVIAVGGVLALIAVLRFPELGLYALVLAIPYGSWLPLPTNFGNVTAVDVLVVVVIALWFARMMAQDRRIAIRFPSLTGFFGLFLLAALLSMLSASSLEASLKEATKWIEMLAMYIFVANDLNESKLMRLMAVMFFAGVSEAAIGMYQFLFRVGPEGFQLFGRFMRAYGTFEQPNPYAGFLALTLPIALGIAYSVISGQWSVVRDLIKGRIGFLKLFTDYWLLFTSIITFVALSAAVLMSWSRGAWLGVGAGLVIAIIVQSRRAFVLSIIVAFILTFAVLLSSINIIPSAVAERFSGIADYFGMVDVRGVHVDDANFAIIERMAHWQAAIDMWLDHPGIGVGIGNYATVYPRYSLPHWDDPLGHAHNYYLNIAAETGTLGLIAYGLLWVAAFWQGWRAMHATVDWQHGLAAGLLGTLVALSVHNGFDNLFVHGMTVQVGLCLGMAGWLNTR